MVKSFEFSKFLLQSNGMIVKECGNLYMAHPGKDCDLSKKNNREMNGVILEKGTDKIIARAAPKILSEQEFEKYFGLDLDECLKNDDVFISQQKEGTVIRVFNYNEEWMVATNRSIDAGQSFFGSEKSFKELFNIYNNLCFSTFNKKCTYGFVLHCKENRIIEPVHHSSCDLIFVLENENIDECSTDCRLFEPAPDNVNSLSDLKSREFGSGKICIVRVKIGGEYIFVKVLNKEYELAQQLKLNYKTIQDAYVNSILKGREEEFCRLFKNVKGKYEIKKKITALADRLQSLYFLKFIKKQEGLDLNPETERILNIVHYKYYKTFNNVIDKKTMRNIFFNQENGIYIPSGPVLKLLSF